MPSESSSLILGSLFDMCNGSLGLSVPIPRLPSESILTFSLPASLNSIFLEPTESMSAENMPLPDESEPIDTPVSWSLMCILQTLRRIFLSDM